MFQIFLDELAKAVPRKEGIRQILVFDNASWHKSQQLNWHHFEVKFPYYKKAVKGNFDVEAARNEFASYVKDLSDDMDMIAFQKLVGRIEVLGELIIKNSSL